MTVRAACGQSASMQAFRRIRATTRGLIAAPLDPPLASSSVAGESGRAAGQGIVVSDVVTLLSLSQQESQHE
jgi:hypothetical protein